MNVKIAKCKFQETSNVAHVDGKKSNPFKPVQTGSENPNRPEQNICFLRRPFSRANIYQAYLKQGRK